MADSIQLIHNTGAGTRILTVNATATSGYTVNWGDGSIINYSTGATATYTYANADTPYTATVYPTNPVDRLTGFYMTSSTTCINIGATLDCSGLLSGLSMFNGLTDKLISFTTSTALNSLGTVSSMFYGCNSPSLTSIDIKATSGGIGTSTSMFEGCSYLTSIAGLPTGSVSCTNSSRMFYGCAALTSISLPTSMASVTTTTSMFDGCSSLTSISLPTMSASRDISYMFSGCTNLITVTGLNTVSVLCTTTQRLFNGCAALTSFSLPGTLNSATAVTGMFSGCASLTTIALPSMSALTDINGFNSTFGDCTSLTTITGLNTINTATTNVSNMFNGCSSLVTLPSLPATLNLVTNASNMFMGTGFTSFNFTALPSMNALLNYSGFFKNCIHLTSITNLTSLKTTVTNLSSLFSGCIVLTLPAMPATLSSVTDIGFMLEGWTFTSFNYSTLPSMSGVRIISGLFKNCINLTTVTNLNTVSTATTNVSSLFFGCTSLTTVPSLPATLNSVTNASSMFEGCTGLTTITVPSMTSSSMSSLGSMFKNCTNLTTLSLTLGSTLGSLSSMASMFENCYVLTSVPTLPIGRTASSGCSFSSTFKNCRTITSASFSSSTGQKTVSMSNCFNGCWNLTTINNLGNISTGTTASGSNFMTDCFSYTGSINVSTITWSQFTILSTTGSSLLITDVVFSGSLNGWADSSGYSIRLEYCNFTGAKINTIVGRLPAGASKHISIDQYGGDTNSYTTPNNGWIISGATLTVILYQTLTDTESYSEVFTQVVIVLQQFIDDESYAEVFTQIGAALQSFVDDESYSEVLINVALALQVFVDDEQYGETVVLVALALQVFTDDESYIESLVNHLSQYANITTSIQEIKPHMSIGEPLDPKTVIGP